MSLISIIIPVYNVEKYLSRCIESVLAQTHKNIEVILVDDGSSDKCPQICDDYAKKDDRVKVLHKNNGGLSSARNAGIEMATGEYIGFVDSDDYIKNNMYEKLLSAILENDADISICDYRYVDESGNNLKENVFLNFENKTFTREQILSNLVFKESGIFVIAVNRLYKRRIFEKIRFPEGRIHEDEFTVHLFYYECDKVTLILDELYVYVMHEGSITKNGISTKTLDAVYAFLERYNFYKDKQLPNDRFFLILAYSKLIYICNNINVRKHIRKIFPVFCLVMKGLLIEKNLRAFKLIAVFCLKYLRDLIKG